MALNDQALTFGDVTSSDYGIYIGGEGVFDAPKRRTKVVEIPGRNGDFAQDLGSYENINVTYPAFYKAPDLATFADDLEAFRAAIASQIGYQRLTDTIHPDQYRMGLFIEGLTVTPVKNNTLGEFDLIFNCKPQRWLTSGGTAVAITGTTGTLNNPTLFEAAPLITAQGYGDISNNGELLARVSNNPIGSIQVLPQWGQDIAPIDSAATIFKTLSNSAQLNSGDSITPASIGFYYDIDTNSADIHSVTVTNETGSAEATIGQIVGDSTASVSVAFSGLTFEKGTMRTYGKSFTLTIEFAPVFAGHWQKVILNIQVSVEYDGDSTITYFLSAGLYMQNRITIAPTVTAGAVTAYSTQTVAEPIHIDLGTGTAWYEIDGAKVNANNIVYLPAELGRLAAGVNTIAKASTFNSLAITPRWWTI